MSCLSVLSINSKICDFTSIILLLLAFLSIISIPDCPVLFNDGRRIVGGTLAPKDKWGWQVSLHFRKTHTCGGAIISTHWIITAAHCFVE
uniref:Peptidase S1 domain-containing protein n=1 Tax=Amphiprion percula TaxID=161767 RepID=A0A3P8RY24_AMPPE